MTRTASLWFDRETLKLRLLKDVTTGGLGWRWARSEEAVFGPRAEWL